MNTSRLSRLVAFLIATLAFASRSWAGDPGSLHHVHELLVQAAGESADAMPPADRQSSLLGDALKELRHVPHVYHGDLKQARRDIESAVDELAKGDASHKARSYILEAADIIKVDAE